MLGWRNGRRSRLRFDRSKGHGGSIPLPSTPLFNSQLAVAARIRRDVGATLAATPARRLAVTVRTYEREVFLTVVKPVAVLVVYLKHQPLAIPLGTLAAACAGVHDAGLEKCTAQAVCCSTAANGALHEHVLPMALRRAAVVV